MSEVNEVGSKEFSRLSLYRLAEGLLQDNPEALMPKFMIELLSDVSAAEKRIEMAGGYHARTEREVEIESFLDNTVTGQAAECDGDVALIVGKIRFLLELVDAGRNRIHLVEGDNERLKDHIDSLDSKLREWSGLNDNMVAENSRLRGLLHKAQEEIAFKNRLLTSATHQNTELGDAIERIGEFARQFQPKRK